MANVEVLDTIFFQKDNKECKEDGRVCVIDKNNIRHVYKPDQGIKDKSIIVNLFNGKQQPMLSDCVVLHHSNKVAIIEIKCGEVTKSLVDDVKEKISNVHLILKSKNITPNELILVYKKLRNPKKDFKVRQALKSIKIGGLPIIEKKYTNKPIML